MTSTLCADLVREDGVHCIAEATIVDGRTEILVDVRDGEPCLMEVPSEVTQAQLVLVLQSYVAGDYNAVPAPGSVWRWLNPILGQFDRPHEGGDVNDVDRSRVFTLRVGADEIEELVLGEPSGSVAAEYGVTQAGLMTHLTVRADCTAREALLIHSLLFRYDDAKPLVGRDRICLHDSAFAPSHDAMCDLVALDAMCEALQIEIQAMLAEPVTDQRTR